MSQRKKSGVDAGLMQRYRVLEQSFTSPYIRSLSKYLYQHKLLILNNILLLSNLISVVMKFTTMDAVNLILEILFKVTLGRLCLTLLSFILLSFSYQIIYYRFFHPLANFPGPFWASVTRLYSAYFNFVGRHYLNEWKLHQKYGMSILHEHDA